MFLYLLAGFIVGSAIGSFLNVVIDRSIRRENILAINRSYCDHCKATLRTFDLIPIMSFILLSARCRYCKKPLSWQYPIVELSTGLLFSLTLWILISSATFSLGLVLYYLFLVSAMIVVFVIDLKFSLIPTTLVFAASLVSLFYNYFSLPSDLFV